MGEKWRAVHFFFFFIAIIAAYSNTLTAEWHMDDLPNIVQNQVLHIHSLNLQSLYQSFFAHPLGTGQLSRPIANFSFAFNWYLGGENVFGYHFANILLHCGVAALLYLVIVKLLETPALQPRQNNSKHLIALLAAAFWVLNPIQTQAVTYIVQRMAVLATFFTLASLLCYLHGRQAVNNKDKLFWFLITLVCFCLALGSKENSIFFPLVLLLIEWIFFQSLRRIKKHHIIFSAGLACLTCAAMYLLTNGNPLNSFSGYEQRSFTLDQRLLTESRIMVFYLSLLFFPTPWRLSVDHDIILSTSLFHPPTTLLSILLLSFLSMWALWQRKSSPLAAFAILFFLLNHVIESTVIPLELIFEHRNYLPSLFLFLPLAAVLVDFVECDRLPASPTARYIFGGVVLMIIFSLAVATYTRNAAWKTEQSLWEDSLAKAPGQSRPYINLAVTYQKMGRNDEAFALCEQSLSKDSPTPAKDRMRAYNNMGNIAMDRRAYAEAVNYYRQALQVNENPFSHYFVHKALLANGQFDEAQKELAALMRDNPGDSELITSMAIVLATRQELPQALTMLRGTLDKSEGNRYLQGTVLMCMGSILSRQGDHKGAEQHFREAFAHVEPLIPLLCVTGNHVRQGNKSAAEAQLKELHKHFTTETLVRTVRSATRQNILFPLETQEFAEFIRFTLVPAPAADGRTP